MVKGFKRLLVMILCMALVMGDSAISGFAAAKDNVTEDMYIDMQAKEHNEEEKELLVYGETNTNFYINEDTSSENIKTDELEMVEKDVAQEESEGSLFDNFRFIDPNAQSGIVGVDTISLDKYGILKEKVYITKPDKEYEDSVIDFNMDISFNPNNSLNISSIDEIQIGFFLPNGMNYYIDIMDRDTDIEPIFKYNFVVITVKNLSAERTCVTKSFHIDYEPYIFLLGDSIGFNVQFETTDSSYYSELIGHGDIGWKWVYGEEYKINFEDIVGSISEKGIDEANRNYVIIDGNKYYYEIGLEDEIEKLINKKVIAKAKTSVNGTIIYEIEQYIEPTVAEKNAVAYGKKKKALTKEEVVKEALENYMKAYNSYYESILIDAKTATKPTRKKGEKDKGTILMEQDEARAGGRMVTFDPGVPFEAKKSAYMAVAEYLDGALKEQIDLGKINIKDELYVVDYKLTKKILNNYKHVNSYKKYGKYYVDINMQGFFSASFGWIRVYNGGKVYNGAINSNPNDVAAVMSDYINETSGLIKNMITDYYHLVISELDGALGVTGYTKKSLETFLRNILSKAPAECGDLVKYGLMIYDDCQKVMEVSKFYESSSTSNINIKKVEELYNVLRKKDYSEESIVNRFIKPASQELDREKRRLEDALFDYLYDKEKYETDETWYKKISRALGIYCPIDFVVYDSSDRVVASYLNGIIEESSDVHIIVSGDRKNIYFTDEEVNPSEYVIKFVGTDDGEASIVEEYYDSEGLILGRTTWYDIPITEDYYFNRDINCSNNEIEPDEHIYLTDCNNIIMSYDKKVLANENAQIQINIQQTEGGTCTGIGQYTIGDEVILQAFPDSGYRFVGWMNNGEFISEKYAYHFVARTNTTYVPVFEETYIESKDFYPSLVGYYEEFAGILALTSKLGTGYTDIVISVLGMEDKARLSNLKVEYYNDDDLKKSELISDAFDDLNGFIYLKGVCNSEYQETRFIDGIGETIARVFYVPDYELIEGNESISLTSNAVAKSLKHTCDTVNTNGYSLIVLGDVNGRSTINVNGGKLTILGEIISDYANIYVTSGSVSVYGTTRGYWHLNHGKLSSFSDAKQIDLDMSNEDDCVYTYGKVLSFGNIGFVASAGTIYTHCNYFCGGEQIFNGNNRIIFEGEDNVEYSGALNEVEVKNSVLFVNVKEFSCEKLLSDISIVGASGYSTVLNILNVNGHVVEVRTNEEQVEISDNMNLYGGTLNIYGDLVCNSYNEVKRMDLNGGILFVSGNVDTRDYGDYSINVNHGKVIVDGDLSGYYVLAHKDDYIKVGGDFKAQINYPYNDEKLIYNQIGDGELHVGRNYYGYIWGNVDVYLENVDVPQIDGKFQTGKLFVSNKDGAISLNAYTYIYINELQSDIELYPDTGIVFCDPYVWYNNIYDEEKLFTRPMSLNGHKMTIHTDESPYSYKEITLRIDTGVDFKNGTILLASDGNANVTYSIDESVIGGYLYLNGGKLIDEANLEVKSAMVIMDNPNDLFSVKGNLKYDTKYKKYNETNDKHKKFPVKIGNTEICKGTVSVEGQNFFLLGENPFSGSVCFSIQPNYYRDDMGYYSFGKYFNVIKNDGNKALTILDYSFDNYDIQWRDSVTKNVVSKLEIGKTIVKYHKNGQPYCEIGVDDSRSVEEGKEPPHDDAHTDSLWYEVEGENNFVYTGSAIKPVVNVYSGTELLTLGKDYFISYKNNTVAYIYDKETPNYDERRVPTITITGKGNYSSKEILTFKIKQADINGNDFSADQLVLKLIGKDQKPKPVLKWNSKVVAATNYTFQYYNADDNGNPVGDALTAVKDAGDYIIILTGKGNFTGTRNVKLTLVSEEQKLASKLTIGTINSQSYTGEEVIPTIVVKDGKTPLKEGYDYAVSYQNNVAVGTATVIVTGMGDYVGTKKATFKITGTPISKATVEGISPSVTYTGNDITFDDIKLYIKATKTTGQIDLDEDDYTVSYQKNLNAGTATVVFTGINGYSGTLKKTFKITAFKEINEPGRFTTTLSSESIVYSKGGAKPEVTVKFTNADGTERTLAEKTDYTVAYVNNSAVNDCSNPAKLPTAKITLKGSYSGTILKNYAITPKDISSVKVEVADKTYANKKGAYKSAVKLYDTDGKTLASKKDYDAAITYTLEDGTTLDSTSIVNANQNIVVTVKAKEGGNYTGTVTEKYRITTASIGTPKVTIKTQTYTGKPIELTADDITIKPGIFTSEFEMGVDYEIVPNTYVNNVKKGTASVVIRGIGNYGGTRKVNFIIKQKVFKWWWR